VAVALRVADPRDPAGDAAREAIAAIRAFLVRIAQRRTLAAQGLGAAMHATIARDAVEDAAIDNSPRVPTESEVLEILAVVA